MLLRARSDDLDTAARMLASLGWPFTVRHPDELRASLQRLATQLDASSRDRHPAARRTNLPWVARSGEPVVERAAARHPEAVFGGANQPR
ncbi:MAG: hypothetical protein ACRDHS_08815 [Actinomycetota bacterium]